MKILSYCPGETPPLTLAPCRDAVMQALAHTVFHFATLDGAVSAMQRDGFASADETAYFPGIKALREQLRDILYATLKENVPNSLMQRHLTQTGDIDLAAIIDELQAGPEATGPVQSGAPRQRETPIAEARLVDDNQSPVANLSRTISRLEDIVRLDASLRRVHWGYDLESVSESLLHEVMGRQALAQWQTIKTLPSLLLHDGFMEQGQDGLRLARPGLQKISWAILREIFSPARRPPRISRLRHNGSTEPHLVGGTRPYRFGDHLHLDTAATLLNAVRRGTHQPPLRLVEEDFEVYRKEPVTRTATVVLLDMSKSMRFDRRYVAAKKVALALYGLVLKRFPLDRIAVAAFSTVTRPVRHHEIPFLEWDENKPYTNMDETLTAACTTLSQYRGYRHQIFLITDGEPTAHTEGRQLFFQFPPHPETLKKTLQAVDRVARRKISLSIFLLAQEKHNEQFMHTLARRAGGKIFHLHPLDLGRCLLMDYLRKKRKVLR